MAQNRVFTYNRIVSAMARLRQLTFQKNTDLAEC
jgi:hypothetical protein